jgi:ABC-2 type transport system permease protein
MSRSPSWLGGALIVARRELLAAFDSAVAYVYILAFAWLSSSIFMNEFFLAGQAELTRYFDSLPLLYCVFLPAITMRSWAEEKKARTNEWLLTLPLKPSSVVFGKFLGAYGLFLLFLLASLPLLAMVQVLGDPDNGRILAGYLGAALLGALLLALGLLCSAFSADQIVAFVLTAVLGFFLVLCGADRVVSILDGLAPGLAIGTFLQSRLSLTPVYAGFVAGRIDLGGLLYFVLGTVGCLALNARQVERDRD